MGNFNILVMNLTNQVEGVAYDTSESLKNKKLNVTLRIRLLPGSQRPFPQTLFSNQD